MGQNARRKDWVKEWKDVGCWQLQIYQSIGGARDVWSQQAFGSIGTAPTYLKEEHFCLTLG